MRSILPTVALAIALLALPAGARAQHPATTLLAGYGGIDHEVSLGPAYHLNLRQRLAGWDSVRIGRRSRGARLPRVEIQAEGFAQIGESGTKVIVCGSPADRFCTRSADPVYLVGAGLVSQVDVSPARWPVQLYFLPATLALYVRGFEEHRQLIGTVESTDRKETRVSGGFGNGLGLRIVAGGVRARLEMRAVLVYDLEGGRGGSLPFSLGLEL